MLVEMWQDIVCPWCRIGKRHLKLALEQWDGEAVQVSYRSFLLDPEIPPEGRDFMETMALKGDGRIRTAEFFDLPRQRGLDVGLVFNFESIPLMSNSMLAHRLLAIAPEELRDGLLDDLQAAFFERGQDIGSLEVLAELARGRGVDAAQVRALAEGTAGMAEVAEDIRQTHELKIRGVPFFVFDRRFGMSGAQPPEMLLKGLRHAVNT